MGRCMVDDYFNVVVYEIQFKFKHLINYSSWDCLVKITLIRSTKGLFLSGIDSHVLRPIITAFLLLVSSVDLVRLAKRVKSFLQIHMFEVLKMTSKLFLHIPKLLL